MVKYEFLSSCSTTIVSCCVTHLYSNNSIRQMNNNNKILRFLKKLFIALLLFLIAFGGYVAIVTRNTKDMTIRQRVLKAVYPAFTWWGRISGKNSKVFVNESPAAPPQSLYNLSVTLNNGADLMFSEFISSEGLIRDAMKNKMKLDFSEEERPFGIQIFGGDEEAMAMSARICETVNPDLVDINFGCPVKKSSK